VPTRKITPTSSDGEACTEVDELRQQLAEARQALDAIRCGEVDALLVSGPDGDRVYTLQGADRPYRFLVERMQQGAATVSDDGTILYCNSRLSEMLGVPLATLIGSRLSDHVVADCVPEVTRFIQHGQVRSAGAEVGMLKQGGEGLPVRLAASPLPPEFSGCLWVIITDLTEERRTNDLIAAKEALRTSEHRLRTALAQLEQHSDQLEKQVADRTVALKESHERLRHSERMASLGTLAAGLGHDVSNTILPLRVRLEALEQATELSPESREHVHAIHLFAEYLASLARGLRLFARDPEQDEPDGATDLAAWCNDVGRFLASSAEKNIGFSCVVSPEVPVARVAPHRLTQAVLNLVHNARDAIRTARGPGAHGRISVLAERDEPGGGVVVSVSDDGCGMTPSTRSRCLEPFFTTKSRGSGGTGLGLSMVFGIVGASGGHIDIQSQPGQGSSVRLYFPAAAVHTREIKPQRRSYISLQDQRMQGVVTAMLRTLERDVVPGSPGEEPNADLWVTDASSSTPEQARSFLSAAPDRRVIVIGGDDAWARAGARVHPDHPPTEALRRDLAQA
jgi:PAS domain S-box-containing protein